MRYIIKVLFIIETLMDSQPNSTGPTHNNSQDNKTLMAVLAYIGPLVIISYLSAKDDPFVKFHIKQGLVLFVIEVVIWLVGQMFWPFWIFLNIVNLATLILSIIGILNAVHKKEKELPLVGHLSKHFSI